MIYRQKYESPIGNMYMDSDGTHLIGLFFEGSKDAKKHATKYEWKELPIFMETKKWLDLYFSGKIPSFTPSYKIQASPFRRQVVEIMNSIPYGNTMTYGDIAQKIADQKGLSKMSAQAVGGAVGWNPICIIIPCHRVVGKNGSLTGYGGGIDHKVALLEHEKVDMHRFFIPKKGTAL